MQSVEVVKALYDCDPDQPDELGFKEGEKIVVTKKINKDWWVSIYNGISTAFHGVALFLEWLYTG